MADIQYVRYTERATKDCVLQKWNYIWQNEVGHKMPDFPYDTGLKLPREDRRRRYIQYIRNARSSSPRLRPVSKRLQTFSKISYSSTRLLWNVCQLFRYWTQPTYVLLCCECKDKGYILSLSHIWPLVILQTKEEYFKPIGGKISRRYPKEQQRQKSRFMIGRGFKK